MNTQQKHHLDETQDASTLSANNSVKDSTRRSDEQASFIDSFAALEDLTRFQKPKFQAFVRLFMAELALCKKAVFASIGLTIFASFVVMAMWLLLNTLVLNALMQQGLSTTVSIGILLLVNGLVLLVLLRELKQCIQHIGFEQTLSSLGENSSQEKE